MKKRTWIEASVFLLLLGIGIAVAMRIWSQITAEAPEPDPTPTPRMAHLLRSVPVTRPEKQPSAPTSTPNPVSVSEQPPPVAEPETGMLVIQVREADGRLPLDPVWVRSRLYGEELPVENGRLVLEVVTGTVPFQVVARTDDELRETATITATISAVSPTLLEFTLPAPAPRFLSSGLELQRQPEGYWSVVGVVQGSAAERAGLQAEDAIISLRGQTPATYTDAQAAAALLGRPGERIPLQVVIRNQQGELEEHQVEMVITKPASP